MRGKIKKTFNLFPFCFTIEYFCVRHVHPMINYLGQEIICLELFQYHALKLLEGASPTVTLAGPNFLGVTNIVIAYKMGTFYYQIFKFEVM